MKNTAQSGENYIMAVAGAWDLPEPEAVAGVFPDEAKEIPERSFLH